MASNTAFSSPSRASLPGLPSELRRLIVSYLLPSTVFPGGKQHLKAANLAHSSLREWVPEYMFRDMTLKHMVEGMASQLELFAVSPENAGLLKHVKHITVQIAPAIRWKPGSRLIYGEHMVEETRRRIARQFNTLGYDAMSDNQQQYCDAYYRAMVEPFCGTRHWNRMCSVANATWGQIFAHFDNLSTISVGTCQRFDMPWGTCTHAFVKQHGKAVEYSLPERFEEDSSVNLAWASSVVVNKAPPSVRALELSMVNIDNFRSNIVVSRLLSQAAIPHPDAPSSRTTTQLTLNTGGLEGLHGDPSWPEDTGSIACVRFWSKRVNMFTRLQTLELRNKMRPWGSFFAFSSGAHTETYGCILSWLLPRLSLPYLTTLRLSGYLMNATDLTPMLAEAYPALDYLYIDNFCLLAARSEPGPALAHLQGKTWFDALQSIIEGRRGLQIFVKTPATAVPTERKQYQLHAVYTRQIRRLPGLELQCGYEGRYAANLCDPVEDL